MYLKTGTENPLTIGASSGTIYMYPDLWVQEISVSRKVRTMTKYFTLDGQAIRENESLPRQFIQVSNDTVLMWDFTGEVAESSSVSSDLLAIVLGTRVRQPVSTLDCLSQVERYLFAEGDRMMTDALSCKPYDAQARKQFADGLAVVQRAHSLWPLIHLYQSFERSYWALRRLAK